MLDLLAERRLHFAYHTYHEDSFGLYRGAALPDPAQSNGPLIDLFTAKLGKAAQ
jgi:endoglucanase